MQILTKSNISKLLTFAAMLMISVLMSNYAFAQEEDEDEEEIPERLKYFREKYEDTLNTTFDKAWQATLNFIKDGSCQITSEKIKDKEDGLKRGVVKSDVCVMAQKTDSTWKLITQYALEPPFIRGGTWTSVRIVYKFIVNDIGSGKVIITQLHEFSGFEDHVSFKAYEFKSNGLIEHNAIEKIKSSL